MKEARQVRVGWRGAVDRHIISNERSGEKRAERKKGKGEEEEEGLEGWNGGGEGGGEGRERVSNL